VQTLGDIYKDMEEEEKSQEEYLSCQSMVGSMFGEDHPAIIPFNGNLISLW
jgi:hypothetical protein